MPLDGKSFGIKIYSILFYSITSSRSLIYFVHFYYTIHRNSVNLTLIFPFQFLENLQSMIDNERRGDFSTFDELPPFKLKYFMRTNSNHEYDQADNSIVNEKRQMVNIIFFNWKIHYTLM